MARLSDSQLRRVVERHFGDLGPDVVDLMMRISRAESSGDPSATGDNYRSGHQSATSRARYDYGLMQINSQHGYDPQRLVSDPDYNMAAARKIYDQQGPGAWTTYETVRSSAPATTQTRTMPTTSKETAPMADPTTIAGGSNVIDQGSLLANLAVQNALGFAGLTGYVRPSSIGAQGAQFIPTLAFQQAQAGQRNIEAQHQLAQQAAAQNQQMLGETSRSNRAREQLSVLQLLGGLRGPRNAFAYNAMLNNVGAPVGREVDPFAAFRGTASPSDMGGGYQPSQPFTFTMPAFNPTFGENQPSGGVGGASPGTAGTPHPLFKPSAGGPNFNFIRSDTNEDGTGGTLRAVPALARGGYTMEPLFIVGDMESGDLSKGNPEIVENPTGAPISVTPLEGEVADGPRTKARKAERYAKGTGAAKRKRVPRYANGTPQQSDVQPPTPLAAPVAHAEPRTVHSRGTDGDTSPFAGMGNPLSFQSYSPQQIAGLPAFQRLLGNREGRAFGQTGLNMTLPGTQTALPFQLNISRLARMLPSEQQLIAGAYETPREMGGLGLDWEDVVQSSVRGAPVGSGFSLLTGYG